MTSMDKPVTRRTRNAYRISVSGAYPEPSGKRLVVTLHGDERGDWISIREHGRRQSITLDVAALYVRGLVSLAQAARRA